MSEFFVSHYNYFPHIALISGNHDLFGNFQFAHMLLLVLSGNFGFNPLLVLTLCLSLVDDDFIECWVHQSPKGP